MEQLDFRIVYVCVVAALGVLTLVRTWLSLNRSKRRYKEQLAGRKRLMALRTSSPVEDPNEAIRKRGLQSIESRFTVTKKLVIPLVIGVTGMMLALPYLGMVPAAVVSVLVAVITVGLGVAARPVVENAIAGLIISFSRLIRVGDTVRVDDWYGTIEDITITHTTLKVWDWRRYVVPNSAMIGQRLVNYSLHDAYQWAHVEFWVSYEADLRKVREIALGAPKHSRYFAPHEEPRFWIMETAREGLRCWVAAWANNPSDAWMLCHDTRTALVEGLTRHGIRTHAFRYQREEDDAQGDDRDESETSTRLNAVRSVDETVPFAGTGS